MPQGGKAQVCSPNPTPSLAAGEEQPRFRPPGIFSDRLPGCWDGAAGQVSAWGLGSHVSEQRLA